MYQTIDLEEFETIFVIACYRIMECLLGILYVYWHGLTYYYMEVHKLLRNVLLGTNVKNKSQRFN